MSAVVKLTNVCKSFGALQVLRDVSFEIDKGEVAVIIGQSGSGKSTALRCVDRLEKVDAGTIEVCGHAVHDPKLDLAKLRRDVGIVFQAFNLFPHLTAEENITLALRHAKKLPRGEAREIAHKMLRQVGLLDKVGSYPDQLSGGQQQRVAIARSLAMSPKVMLFDEVTSALDPQLTGEVLSVIEDLAAQGMTMLMVTHEMGFARKIADRVIFMQEGRIAEAGGPDILSNPRTELLSGFLRHVL